MTIDFENETEDSLDMDLESFTREVVSGVLAYMKCPWEAAVNVLVTSEEEIHTMNRDFRGVDRETDVLSFPLTEFISPGDFEIPEDIASDCFDPDSGELLLGDIVICLPKVRSQAEEYGHSVRREYAFLLTHSLLHLTGYDHIVPEDAEIMEEKQREILSYLQIPRE